MPAPLLIQISYALSNHKNYCILCLRTDEERRLESPKQITKFLQTIGQCSPFQFPFQKVCYVCERQAALANRLVISSDASIRAHTLVLQLKKRPSQFAILAEALQADAQDVAQVSLQPFWLRQMLECESKLQRQLIKTQLLQTEVLQLSSEQTIQQETTPIVIDDDDTLQTDELASQSSDSRDSCVLPDVALRNEKDTFDLNDKPKILESTIIFDEDDIDIQNDEPIASIQYDDPKSTEGNKPNTERNKPHSSSETENQIEQRYFVAAQDHTENDDQPIASVQYDDPKSTEGNKPNTERNKPHSSSETDNQIEQQYFVAAQDHTENDDQPINGSLHPIVFNNGITVPTLSANFQNGQLVETATNIPIQSQIAIQTGEYLSFVTDPNEIYETLKKLNKTMNEATSTNVRNESGNFKVFVKEKEPKLRSDRIDREDKIPMDVISFNDEENEKDVCYNKRKRHTMPEIGICNVTSLPPAQAQCEVVDLCSGPDLEGGKPPHLPPLTAGPRRRRKLE